MIDPKAIELLKILKRHNVQVTVKGSQLNLTGSIEKIPKNLIDEIKQNKEQLLKLLSNNRNGNISKAIKLTEKKEYYSLSSAQKRHFFLYEFNKNSLVYNVPEVIKVIGRLNVERLKQAFNELILKHEILRTSIVIVNDTPKQKIFDKVDFNIEFFKSSISNCEIIINNFIRPFDLNKAPLMRVGVIELADEEFILITDMHHIITDEFTSDLFKRDYSQLYNGKNIIANKFNYKDYAEWQQNKITNDLLAKQKNWWLGQFKDGVPEFELPYDFKRPLIMTNEGSSVDFSLTQEETHKLKSIAIAAESTLFMVLIAVYNILFAKLGNDEDILIGTPVAGRNHPDLENITGMLANTVVLKNWVDPLASFRDFLGLVKSNCIQAFENQDYQYEELINELNLTRSVDKSPLFNVVFSMHNINNSNFNLQGMSYQPYNSKSNTIKFDLVLHASEIDNNLYFSLEYYAGVFNEKTIKRFVTYFRNIISSIVESISQPIKNIQILPDNELAIITESLTGEQCGYPHKVIHQVFEEQVALNPNKVAVILDNIALTYGCLNEKANQLAHLLLLKNIARNEIVALLTERSLETIIGILAILKAGGAYMPIDPDYPKERIDYILKDSNTEILISNAEIIKSLNFDVLQSENERIRQLILFDKDLEMIKCQSKHNLTLRNDLSDICYVIYTSGTTGKPKGVLVEHRNVIRLMFNDKFQFNFDGRDVWTMFHSPCFDFSVWEMYGALLYGAKLIIIPKMLARDPFEVLKISRKQKVTILNQTPSAFNNLMGAEKEENEKTLYFKYVIFGGEALKPGALKEWFEKYPETKPINMFGITETTVHVTYKEIGRHEIENNISNIGKPIPTSKASVSGLYNDVQPFGVKGELLIGGEGVARGYLNKVEQNSDKFISNPFDAKEKIYRSGDLARTLISGELEYIGRNDRQIQLRGFRIGLGEIENELMNCPQIKKSLVLSSGEATEMFLAGYYVSDNPIHQSELREHLLRKLPDYMIPSVFIHLKELPLTANGKIDVKLLPLPLHVESKECLGADNKIEETLMKIWQEVLGAFAISRNSSFFSSGGDSIKAIALVSKINKAFKIKIKLLDLYQNDTIEKLAVVLLDSEGKNIDDPYVNQTIIELEQLKREILSELDNSVNVEDVYPMTEIQKGMVFHSLRDLDEGLFHDQIAHFIEIDDYNNLLLYRALYLMCEKHPILRVSFELEKYSEPVQIVFKEIQVDFEFHNLNDKEKHSQEDFIKEYLIQDRRNSFIMGDPGLWRYRVFSLGNNLYCFCFICHHAIIDGWSDASFNAELNNIYSELLQNADYKPANLKSTFKDFVIEQIAATKDLLIKEFWKKELENYRRYPVLSTEKTPGSSVFCDYLSEDLNSKLFSMSNELNISIKNIFFSVFLYNLYLFSVYSNTDEFTISISSNQRPVKEDADKVLGCFLNPIPFRFYFKDLEKLSWFDFFKLIDQKLLELHKYSILSLPEIVKTIHEKSGDKNPIFDISFNFIDFHIYSKLEKQYKPSSGVNQLCNNDNGFDIGGGAKQNYPLVLTVDASLNQFKLEYMYVLSFISTTDIYKFNRVFKDMLETIVSEPYAVIPKNDLLNNIEGQTNISEVFEVNNDFDF